MEAFCSSTIRAGNPEVSILVAYVLMGCGTISVGPARVILEVTHFHHHLVDLITVGDGFKEVTGGRRAVRGAFLGDGNLGDAIHWAGI